MTWLKRLQQSFSRRRLFGDLSEEIRAHIEEKVEELVASGMSRKDAAAAARRQFGNVTLIEEDARDVWRCQVRTMDQLVGESLAGDCFVT